MKQKIYVTVPNGDGWLHKVTHYAICKILSDSRYQIRHDCPTHQPYVQNLHKCMWDFLDGGEDFWLSMDADNPPVKNPLDLVGYNCDLVGFPTPIWHNAVKGDRPYYFNVLKWVGEGYQPFPETEGLKEVDAIGSGCFLVSKRVIEALKNKQPFSRKWDSTGLVEMGCDYSFCQKVKSANFRIWTHFDYPCHHFNELDLLEIITSFNSIK